jgi:imidazoleglycerol-phosphate dehydratase/histidinol-phosphatase
MQPKKVLFIDRDGTILIEPEDKQIDRLHKFRFYPGVISALKKIKDLDFELALVSNQDGLGTAAFPETDFRPLQDLMLQILAGEEIKFDHIFIDPSLPADNSPNRKPGTGMLKQFLSNDYDLANSYVIGDRESDIALARNLGAKAIFIGLQTDHKTALTTQSWEDIYAHLALATRSVMVARKTGETNIRLRLNLDGSGQANLDTGIGFLDHMLTLLARHSSIDLDMSIKGDLHVDEHHTTEDCAIALGQAFHQALGTKVGLNRYGFVLPMDESYAMVALDFSGRSELIWDAEFKRENIGLMPTEMFKHFFKSFCDNARCNLLVRARGENEHHKIEAIFKAFARTIRQAIKRDPESGQVPSSKDVL